MPGLLNLAECDLAIAAVLDEQLEEVALVLERQLASDLSTVNALCRHIEQDPGKRLRPILVLLSGLATGRPPGDAVVLGEKHRVVAAVVEMIHMATLTHDDVLDEARVRRRVATMNRLRGNETAVMLGDYLISNAFHLCSSLMDPALNLSLGEVTNTICEGELLQLNHRDDHDLDEPTYLDIVGRKTASLIGECCRLGAMLSGGGSAICTSTRRFGFLLGTAFQIQDDVLDLIGDEAVVGKSLGRDLDGGNVTLPLIRYLAGADPAERADALRLFELRDTEKLRLRLVDSGAVRDAHREARSLIQQAKAELSSVAPSPARDLLEALADAVTARQF